MIEPLIIITNNPMCKEKYTGKYELIYVEGTVAVVYKKVRDYIHSNHRLLTHPLISSIKPNEIPFRTVIISKKRDNTIDIESINMIENSISTTEKFLKDFGIPNWSEKILEDFQLIDYDIIFNAIKN
ncbi:GrdX family protein [Clostridiales bacterium oral taxon 876 str. F0540]|nr:GrdX family protein [Clostridiales bacterium oral taxon 876 str. F0540]